MQNKNKVKCVNDAVKSDCRRQLFDTFMNKKNDGGADVQIYSKCKIPTQSQSGKTYIQRELLF